MLNDYDISFKEGNMITPKMLDTMYRLPRDMFELIFKNMSDGIISGMDITVEDEKLIVTKGVFKSGSRLFILKEDAVFSGCKSSEGNFVGGHYYILYIDSDSNGIKTTESDVDYVSVVNADIILAERDTFDASDKFILCRFKGKPHIPKDCETLSKSTAKEEVFYILNRCHADIEEPTYHQAVFRAVYKKLVGKKNKHPLDYALITEFLNKNLLSVQTIRYYISEAKININKNASDAILFNTFLKAIEALEFKVEAVTDEKSSPKSDKNEGYNGIWLRPVGE